ncbi:MAG: hypothetical protein AAGK14_06860 [Verrucomicrobiota bacterium]
MTPTRVAIFAAVIIVIGAGASFWLEEETKTRTLEGEKVPARVEPAAQPPASEPRLVVGQGRVRSISDQKYQLTYSVTNEGRAATLLPTRVFIFPYRYGETGEAPISEGQYGWDISVADQLDILEPGEKVTRKVEFFLDPQVEPVNHLIPRTHFSVAGHPQQ